jgi:uncharacterized membrane protein YdjX (TVP38/TMEM64 family)
MRRTDGAQEGIWSKARHSPGQYIYACQATCPLAVLLGGLAVFFLLDLEQYFRFDVLRDNRHVFLALVEQYGLLASCAYMAIYTLVVAFSLPGAAVLSITGGFLFGAVWGMVHIGISATLVPRYCS